MIAEALNLSRAEVHGVVTFYHDFRDEPAGRHVLKLCRAEACQSMGGERLAQSSSLDRFGVDWGGTTPDGASRWRRSTAWASAPRARRRCSTASRSGG